MDLQTTIFRRKTGRHKGKWVLEVRYWDEVKGKQCAAVRMFSYQSEAKDARPQLEKDLRSTHGQIQTGRKMTFADLCKLAKAGFYREAVIEQGRKVAGVKSPSTASFLKVLEEFFGERKLSNITSGDLASYKIWRFKLGDLRIKDAAKKRPVSHGSVNRELVVLRRLMKFAYGRGWTDKDVFAGAGVIDRDAEKPRDRVLSDAEEDLLLAFTSGERSVSYKRKTEGIVKDVEAKIKRDNPELRPVILLALDSGMRRGEILKLRWEGIDFDNRTITVIASHTKTQTERLAPLTARVAEALRKMPTASDKVFSTVYIQRSWSTSKRLAGLDALQFRDLRRTAGTRMELCGIPHVIVQKILGHSAQDITGRHYIAATAETIRDVAERLDARTRRGSVPRSRGVSEVGERPPERATESQLIN